MVVELFLVRLAAHFVRPPPVHGFKEADWGGNFGIRKCGAAGITLETAQYLVEQGVHILEFHNLEELARDKVSEFCYVAATNKVAGAVSGFTLRPLALR